MKCRLEGIFDGQGLWYKKSGGGILHKKKDIRKGFLEFVEHPRSVRYEKDGGCVGKALPGIVEVYTWQLLSLERYSTANEEICHSSLVFAVERDGIKSWK